MFRVSLQEIVSDSLQTVHSWFSTNEVAPEEDGITTAFLNVW